MSLAHGVRLGMIGNGWFPNTLLPDGLNRLIAYRPERSFREARRLVRQRVGLLLQGARSFNAHVRSRHR